jgi:hypothetical protein
VIATGPPNAIGEEPALSVAILAPGSPGLGASRSSIAVGTAGCLSSASKASRAEHEYRRAYGEINYFEELLVSHGILVVKFWIHITKAEQLRRFRARRRVAYKRYKIPPTTGANRSRWEDYTLAVNEIGRAHQHSRCAVDAGRRQRQETSHESK